MFNTDESAALLFNLVPEMGPVRYQALVNAFGSASEALHHPSDWLARAPVESTLSDSFQKNIQHYQRQLETEINRIHENKWRIYFHFNADYPVLLKAVTAPPPVLYVQGSDISSHRNTIALVGSRRCTHYGARMARQFSQELVANKFITVSGLARGIDTHVHKASLENGGQTWAVLGHGFSYLYPPENKALADAIIASGALITEFSSSFRPFPANFPRRNRLIAGLCAATVLLEGDEQSGSLITARLAAEEGRDVFALPGPVTSPLSAAPHRLLKQGAKMIESAADIFQELQLSYELPGLAAPSQHEDGLTSAHEKMILDWLSAEPVHREQVVQHFSSVISDMAGFLLDLELRDKIQTLPGGMLVRKH